MKRLGQFCTVSLVLVWGLGVLPVAGEVTNEGRVFDKVEVCSDYIKFLEGAVASDPSACLPLAEFLISTDKDIDTDKVRGFLRSLFGVTQDSSALGAIANTLWATVHKDPIGAFQYSELAGRRVAIKLTQSGDIERAVLYSHFLSEIQRYSLLSLCGADSNCKAVEPISSVSDLMGGDFSSLDEMRQDIVLLCLVNIDAYLTPVRSVLSSEKFERCISSLEGN